MAEVLSSKIRQNQNIIGTQYQGRDIKCAQYADDLWLLLAANAQNVEATLKELEDFKQFSGLRTNYDKSKILPIGTIRHLQLSKRFIWASVSKSRTIWTY